MEIIPQLFQETVAQLNSTQLKELSFPAEVTRFAFSKLMIPFYSFDCRLDSGVWWCIQVSSITTKTPLYQLFTCTTTFVLGHPSTNVVINEVQFISYLLNLFPFKVDKLCDCELLNLETFQMTLVVTVHPRTQRSTTVNRVCTFHVYFCLLRLRGPKTQQNLQMFLTKFQIRAPAHLSICANVTVRTILGLGQLILLITKLR